MEEKDILRTWGFRERETENVLKGKLREPLHLGYCSTLELSTLAQEAEVV